MREQWISRALLGCCCRRSFVSSEFPPISCNFGADNVFLLPCTSRGPSDLRSCFNPCNWDFTLTSVLLLCSTHKLALTIAIIPSLNIAAGQCLTTHTLGITMRTLGSLHFTCKLKRTCNWVSVQCHHSTHSLLMQVLTWSHGSYHL